MSMCFLKMEETDDIAFAAFFRGALLEGAGDQHVAQHVLEGSFHFRPVFPKRLNIFMIDDKLTGGTRDVPPAVFSNSP